MPNYLTPGVYIEEISSGARPIQAVGTSTAGFVGLAPLASAHVLQASAITNFSQFMREYCPEQDVTATPLAQAVYGFFLNGGSRCYVVNHGPSATIAQGLETLARIGDVQLVAAPGASDAASHEALLSHCESLADRFALCDPPENVDRLDRLVQVGRADDPSGGLRPRQSDRGFGAFYFPWLRVRDPFDPKNLVTVPPSGHMAGVYARVDSTRGVHKAPANESIHGALDLTARITSAEQAQLNANGINCLRFFPREGIRVWGARTLAEAASEWRYLNVRRLFTMLEQSIMIATRWVVFEPNDQRLWKSIVRDVSAFLMQLWREGALLGAKPEEAFFVKCDAETNPQSVIDAGRVEIVIGAAPVKPAEFVIFKVGQDAGGSQSA